MSRRIALIVLYVLQNMSSSVLAHFVLLSIFWVFEANLAHEINFSSMQNLFCINILVCTFTLTAL